jgi:hypothetical protein
VDRPHRRANTARRTRPVTSGSSRPRPSFLAGTGARAAPTAVDSPATSPTYQWPIGPPGHRQVPTTRTIRPP